ncbi:MAG: HK97 family phage prohead protease [Pseudomonadota bacterium]
MKQQLDLVETEFEGRDLRFGTIEGWAAIYNDPDLNGDIIAPGAFDAHLRRGQSLPMLYQHAASTPIGRWTEFRQHEKGLYVRGEIVLSAHAGLEAYTLIKARILDGLSIGYKTVRATSIEGGRRILGADLWEISVVTFPMAPAARIVRSGIGGLAENDQPRADEAGLAGALQGAASAMRDRSGRRALSA